MRTRTKAVIGGTALAAAAVASGGVAFATANGDSDGGRDEEAPITGQALDRASSVALEETGGGRVTETEVETEAGDSYYEVEVSLPDGSQTEVELDKDFNVVASESDDDAAGDD